MLHRGKFRLDKRTEVFSERFVKDWNWLLRQVVKSPLLKVDVMFGDIISWWTWQWWVKSLQGLKGLFKFSMILWIYDALCDPGNHPHVPQRQKVRAGFAAGCKLGKALLFLVLQINFQCFAQPLDKIHLAQWGAVAEFNHKANNCTRGISNGECCGSRWEIMLYSCCLLNLSLWRCKTL